jgi:hypothetical protein
VKRPNPVVGFYRRYVKQICQKFLARSIRFEAEFAQHCLGKPQILEPGY